MSQTPRLYTFKISVIGDYAVGKTSLIKRYMTNSFDEGYLATLGAAISNFESSVGKDKVQLQVWDLAGQTSFRRVRVQYLFGTEFAIVVFDVTRKESLECVIEWVEDVRQGAPEVLLYLVGNKCDLKEDRVVEADSAQAIMKKLNMVGYLETSAKEGTNVKNLFQEIVQILHERAQR
ncbi:MAG: Rab family GTPase [Promethearchaeota archaeon]